MGLLGKIGDKIGEKIDDKLNPKVETEHFETKVELKEKMSDKNFEKYHDELTELYEQYTKIFSGDYYDDRDQDLLDICLKMLDYDPVSPQINLNLARHLTNVGRYEDAYIICSTLLEDYPNVPEVELRMGNIFLYSKKANEAIPFYDSVIQKTPYTEYEALSAKHGKAMALESMHNYEEAVQFCNDQLSLHENDKLLLRIKNKSLEFMKETKKQMEIVDKQIQQEDELLEQTNSTNNEKSLGTSDSFVADELSKLAKLKEQGVISEEEFSKMKQKLMEKM